MRGTEQPDGFSASNCQSIGDVRGGGGGGGRLHFNADGSERKCTCSGKLSYCCRGGSVFLFVSAWERCKMAKVLTEKRFRADANQFPF